MTEELLAFLSLAGWATLAVLIIAILWSSSSPVSSRRPSVGAFLAFLVLMPIGCGGGEFQPLRCDTVFGLNLPTFPAGLAYIVVPVVTAGAVSMFGRLASRLRRHHRSVLRKHDAGHECPLPREWPTGAPTDWTCPECGSDIGFD